jgi:predicted transposase YbfD/YdcC
MNKKFESVNELDGDLLGEEVNARTVGNGIVVNQDLSMGIAFKLSAPDTSAFGSDRRIDLYNKIRSALNSLPGHFDVEFRHVPVFRSTELEALYQGYEANIPNGLLGEVIREEQKLNVDGMKRKEYRFFTSYLVLIRRFEESVEKRRARSMKTLRSLRLREDEPTQRKGLFGKLKEDIEGMWMRLATPGQLARYEESEYREAANEVLRQARSMAQSLTEAGFEPKMCDDNEAIELFYSYWNRNRFDEGLRANTYDDQRQPPISDYFVLSPFQWDPRGKEIPRGVFFLDGLYHKLVSVINTPREIGQPVWPHFQDMLLFDGPKNMEMIVKCVQGDRAARSQLLKKEIRHAENAIATKKRQDDQDSRYLAELKNEKSELDNSLERTWKAGVFFHLWDKDPERLADASNAMLKLANQLDVELCEETVGLHRYWRATQPFWTGDPDRHRLFDYSSRQLTGMLPLSGQKTHLFDGCPLGGVFETATGSLFNLFFHSPKRTANGHFCICAGSRKGKSVLMNRLLIAMRRYPMRVTIVDLGGSFKRFCEVMAGNYLLFDVKDHTRCLNPLFIQGFRMPDEEELRSRVLMLEMMLCDPRSNQRFTPDELPRIAEALRLTYRKKIGAEVTLSDLQEQFKEQKMTNWAARMHEWVGTGSKAALLDGRNTINLEHPLTVIDFQKVKDDTHLSAVLFHVATMISGQMAAKYPNDLKFLIYDEASRFLRGRTTAEAIDQEVRTLAKHGVSVGVLSQNFSDFTCQDIIKETFVNNVPTWIFLGQDSQEVVQEIAREKRLSPEETSKLAGLKTVFGKYSELLVVQNVGGVSETTHCFSVATPLGYAMTTTAASDRARFAAYEEEGLTIPDAIRRFAVEYPEGADVQFTKQTAAA